MEGEENSPPPPPPPSVAAMAAARGRIGRRFSLAVGAGGGGAGAPSGGSAFANHHHCPEEDADHRGAGAADRGGGGGVGGGLNKGRRHTLLAPGSDVDGAVPVMQAPPKKPSPSRLKKNHGSGISHGSGSNTSNAVGIVAERPLPDEESARPARHNSGDDRHDDEEHAAGGAKSRVRFANESDRHDDNESNVRDRNEESFRSFSSTVTTPSKKTPGKSPFTNRRSGIQLHTTPAVLGYYMNAPPKSASKSSKKKQLNRSALLNRSVLLGGDLHEDSPPSFLRDGLGGERLREQEDSEQWIDPTAPGSPFDPQAAGSSFLDASTPIGRGCPDSSDDDSSSGDGGDPLMQSDPTQLSFPNYVQMASTKRPKFAHLAGAAASGTAAKRSSTSSARNSVPPASQSSQEPSQRSTSMEQSVSMGSTAESPSEKSSQEPSPLSTSMEHSALMDSAATATSMAAVCNSDGTVPESPPAATAPASPSDASRTGFAKVSSPPGDYAVTSKASSWAGQENLIRDMTGDVTTVKGGGKNASQGGARLPPRGRLSLPVAGGTEASGAQSQPMSMTASSPLRHIRRFSLPGEGPSSPSLLTSDRPVPPLSGSAAKRRTSNLLSIARNIKAKRLSREQEYQRRFSSEEEASNRRSRDFSELSAQHKDLEASMTKVAPHNDPRAPDPALPPLSVAVTSVTNAAAAASDDQTVDSLDFLSKAIGSSPATSLLASRHDDTSVLPSSPEGSTAASGADAATKEPPLVQRHLEGGTEGLTSGSPILGGRTDALYPRDKLDPQDLASISAIMGSKSRPPQCHLDREGRLRRESASDGITELLGDNVKDNNESGGSAADSDATAAPPGRLSDASLSSQSGDRLPEDPLRRTKSSSIGSSDGATTELVQAGGLQRPPRAPSSESHRAVQQLSATQAMEGLMERSDPTEYSPLQNARDATEDLMAYDFQRQSTSGSAQFSGVRLSVAPGSGRFSDKSSPSTPLPIFNEGDTTEALIAAQVLRPSITSGTRSDDGESDRLSSASTSVDVARLLADESPVSSTTGTFLGQSATYESGDERPAPLFGLADRKPDKRRYSKAGPFQDIEEETLDLSVEEATAQVDAKNENENHLAAVSTGTGSPGLLKTATASEAARLPNLGALEHSESDSSRLDASSQLIEQGCTSPVDADAATKASSLSSTSTASTPVREALPPRTHAMETQVLGDEGATDTMDTADDTGTVPKTASVDFEGAATAERSLEDANREDTTGLISLPPETTRRPESLTYSDLGDEGAPFSKRARDGRQLRLSENEHLASGPASAMLESRVAANTRDLPSSEGSPPRASSIALADSPARNTRSAEKKRRQMLQDSPGRSEVKRSCERAEKQKADEKQRGTPPSKRRSSQVQPSTTDSPVRNMINSRLNVSAASNGATRDEHDAESQVSSSARKRKESSDSGVLEPSRAGDESGNPILESCNDQTASVTQKHVKFQSHDGYVEFNSQSPSMSIQTPLRSYKKQSRDPSSMDSLVGNPLDGNIQQNETPGVAKLLNALPSADSHMSVDSELSGSDNGEDRTFSAAPVEKTRNMALSMAALRQTVDDVPHDDDQTTDLEKVNIELFGKDELRAPRIEDLKQHRRPIQQFDAVGEDVTAELETDLESLMRQASGIAEDVTTELETDFESVMRQAPEFHKHERLELSAVAESSPFVSSRAPDPHSRTTRRFSLNPAQRRRSLTPPKLLAWSPMDETTSDEPLENVEMTITQGEILRSAGLRDWSPSELVDDPFQHLCSSLNGYAPTYVSLLVGNLSHQLESSIHRVGFDDVFEDADNGKTALALRKALRGRSDTVRCTDLQLLAKAEQDQARSEMELWLIGGNVPVLEDYLDGELEHFRETLNAFDFRSSCCLRANDWLSSSEDKAARNARRKSLGRRKACADAIEDESAELESELRGLLDECSWLEALREVVSENAKSRSQSMASVDSRLEAERCRRAHSILSGLGSIKLLIVTTRRLRFDYVGPCRAACFSVSLSYEDFGAVACQAAPNPALFDGFSGKSLGSASEFFELFIAVTCKEISETKLTSPGSIGRFLQLLELQLQRLQLTAFELVKIKGRASTHRLFSVVSKPSGDNVASSSFIFHVEFPKLAAAFAITRTYPISSVNVAVNCHDNSFDVNKLQDYLEEKAQRRIGWLSRTCDVISAFCRGDDSNMHNERSRHE